LTFLLHEEWHWDFEGACIGSIDCFW
jgi:hypothetical protein